MVILVLAASTTIYLGWGFITREPQYTGFSWLVLLVLIADLVVITSVIS